MTQMLNPAAVTTMTARTAEHVSQGHPDKYADQVAEGIVDAVLDAAREAAAGDEASPDHPRHQRTAVEMVAKDHVIFVSGEVKLGPKVAGELDVPRIVRGVWEKVGYGRSDMLTVIDHLQQQSADIAQGIDPRLGVASEGAGDQGIMVGFATNETPNLMPLDWALAQQLCLRIQTLKDDGVLPWLGADTKTQVTLSATNEPMQVIIAAQHSDAVSDAEIRGGLMRHAVEPVLGAMDPAQVVINGTGRFVTGGTIGDAGVVGRKIVVDAYGPSVPVGGGAFSGKDPTKVDRSAAYMARHLAKTIVSKGLGDAKSCLVRIAYGIGQTQPAMVTAQTDTGADLGAWVRKNFDLSPRGIINYLDLLRLNEGAAWSYQAAAAFGHFGRDQFPWERIAEAD